jgi:DNA-binding MarR family transcriptional regulator
VDKKKAAELHAHIGFWLRIVSNSVSQSFAKKLESVGISVAEWVVMREMYCKDETTSPSSVADMTGLTRGAISKLIDRLLAKDLVARAEDSSDRRYQEIRLTKKGIALVPKLALLADANEEDFFSKLSAKERKDIVCLLKKIAKLNELTKYPTE